MALVENDSRLGIRLRLVLVGALLSLVGLVPLLSPGVADARYSASPPTSNARGDALLMTRIVMAQERPYTTWNRCTLAGYGLIDHITTDRRRWFKSKRGFRKSVIGKTYGYYINRYGVREGLCRWIQNSNLRRAVPVMIPVWYKAVRADYIKNIRRGLKKARCALKWGVYWTALGTFTPVKFATIPWVVKNAILNTLSAKDYC